jgi:thiol-disulfide isomerase/thioredoxin
VTRTVTFHVSENSPVPTDSITLFYIHKGGGIIGKAVTNNEVTFEYEALDVDLLKINTYTENIDQDYAQIYVSGKDIDIYITGLKEHISLDTIVGDTFHYQTLKYYKTLEASTTKEELHAELLSILEENHDNLFGKEILQIQLQLFANDPTRLAEISTALDDQSKEMQTHFFYTDLLKSLRNYLKNKPIKYTKFKLLDLEGKRTKIEKVQKDYLILDFWFVGCPPCVRDHQLIVKDLHQGNFPANAELVGVSVDEDYSAVKKYVVEHNITWQNYLEGNSKRVNQLGVTSYPTYILMDAKGKVLQIQSSYEALKQSMLLLDVE